MVFTIIVKVPLVHIPAHNCYIRSSYLAHVCAIVFQVCSCQVTKTEVTFFQAHQCGASHPPSMGTGHGQAPRPVSLDSGSSWLQGAVKIHQIRTEEWLCAGHCATVTLNTHYLRLSQTLWKLFHIPIFHRKYLSFKEGDMAKVTQFWVEIELDLWFFFSGSVDLSTHSCLHGVLGEDGNLNAPEQ